MKLIVGLGNPGEQYQKTRHNAGFMAVDFLARDASLDCAPWNMNKKFNAEIARCARQKYILMKPHTFMNESGLAVKKALHFFKISTDNLWVFHDDLDIQFGSFKIQKGRGSAGHNGIESIFTHLNTRDFTRIRIGVNNTNPRKEGAEFVLAPFGKTEQKELPALIKNITKEFLKKINSPTA